VKTGGRGEVSYGGDEQSRGKDSDLPSTDLRSRERNGEVVCETWCSVPGVSASSYVFLAASPVEHWAELLHGEEEEEETISRQ